MSDSVKPCPKCGGTERYKNGKCAPCSRAYSRQWQKREDKALGPCIKCGSTERYKNGTCISCDKERGKRYRETNREKATERMRQWRRANPEKAREGNRRRYYANLKKRRESNRWYRQANRKKEIERNKQYRQANREAIKKYAKRYYRNNKKKLRENLERWLRINPEYNRIKRHRRRARKARVHSEPYNFEAICTYYDNKCLCCGRDDLDLTADHITPISKGGPDIAENIQPLCLSCNSSKGTQTIDYRPKRTVTFMGIQYSIPNTYSGKRNDFNLQTL